MSKLNMTLLFFFLSCSVSHAETYSAPLLKADWALKKAASYCRLIHHIPLYGSAVFMHQSGGVLRFSISEQRFKPEIVKASLTTDTSLWVRQSINNKDYVVTLDHDIDNQNYPSLSVYGEAAERMLDALSNGLYPTFSYVRTHLGGLAPETKVAVSSINFKRKYKQFIDCRKDFLPVGFKDKLENSLFFKAGSRSLNAVVLNQLKDAARYVKDVQGSQVVIVSDTAIAGSRDNHWFLNRAKKITSKLMELGIPRNKLSIKNGLFNPATNSNTIYLRVFGPDALKAIYYRKGNTKLTQSEKKRLNLLVHYAEEFLPNSQLVIKSHTDSKGSRANNLKISQHRGEVIKRYLISRGMEENKVRVKAYGESKPAKSNRFPPGRAQNRRAIIDFVG